MLSTYTKEFTQGLIQQYLTSNMVAFLIYAPSLGTTDTPTADQLTARKALTMASAAATEIAVTNGYKRAVPTIVPDTTPGNEGNFTASAAFTAGAGSFAQATHICYARGANLTGASSANGNNRGDTAGTLIKVEPLIQAPLAITAGVTFTHSTSFQVVAGTI